MAKRIISDKQRAWLADELNLWHSQGVLSADQATRILELYETRAQLAERKRSRAVFALMGVAAFLVGLAALLLIAYNWEAMPRSLKLVIIFGVIIGTHAGGFHLRYQRQVRVLSEVVFFLACLFYGAGIWLVAQVFHLNAHYPDGVWWWALGVLPFALCLDTLLLHAVLVALLALWVGLEILGFGHLGAWVFGRWPGLANGAYTLPLLALPGLLWAYRKGSPTTIGLYAPLLAWWVILQPFAWRWEVNPTYFIGSVGGLFLLIAESHRPGSVFAIPYRLYGMLLSAGVLVPLSFYTFNTHVVRSRAEAAGVVQTLAILVLAVATIVLAAIARRKYAGEQIPLLDQIRDMVRRQWLALGVVALMAFLSLWSAVPRPIELIDQRAGLVPTVLANAGMIACALWLMRVGLREDRGRPFAAGVLYFLLWAVLRYFDLFGDFGGMLGAALMFFLCGATLFGVAMYWRRRKEIRHG